jgi:hypothetical protein
MYSDFSAKRIGAITAVSVILLLAAPAASEVQINDEEGLRMVEGNISMGGNHLTMGGGDIFNANLILKDGYGGTGIGFESFGTGIAGPSGDYLLEIEDVIDVNENMELDNNVQLKGNGRFSAPVEWNDQNFQIFNGVSIDDDPSFEVVGCNGCAEQGNVFVESVLRIQKGYLDMEGNSIKNVDYCNGCDLAETVEKDKKAELGTGDVVSLDEDGELIKTSSEYESEVAGVVSSDPVILMGARKGGVTLGVENYPKNGSVVIETENSTKEVPLALAGLVPVKASASNGAIEPGDKLATSNISGYAMKAEPIIERNGRKVYGSGIIGKAMEPLESGKGKIQMLASIE